MSNTREIATQILTDIYKNYEFYDTSICHNKEFNRLELRDKAFVKLIVLNTLRRNVQIEKVVNDLVKKPLKKKDLYILNLIRMSICQILFLDIKEYSVVNTAVEISKSFKKQKFINGLLRNVCRNKNKIKKSIINISNIPDWIRIDIEKSLGKKTLNKISNAIVKEPFIDIKIKESHSNKIDWKKILNGKFINKEILRIKNEGKIEKKPFYDDGFWWVQGLSSTLPVMLISKKFYKEDNSKISILDVGAAPGGKTFQLIEKGFNVTALEISERRIRRLKENLKRLNYSVKIINHDFLFFKTKSLFDCILIDAPCTASGLMQKKPEILIRDKKYNLEKLTSKQLKMLDNAIPLLKKGGYILYSVCSIHSDEGEKIIKNFLQKNNQFETVRLGSSISNIGTEIKKGMLLITPDGSEIDGGIDGFFIALLRKKNNL